MGHEENDVLLMTEMRKTPGKTPDGNCTYHYGDAKVEMVRDDGCFKVAQIPRCKYFHCVILANLLCILGGV